LRSWVGFYHRRSLYDRQERAAGHRTDALKLLRYALDGGLQLFLPAVARAHYAGIFIALMGFWSPPYSYAVRRILGIEIAPTGYTTLGQRSCFSSAACN